ncbi:MAG TPA: metallopeptidase TldD-related protein [Myxococcota bacterium]|jgi:TldD protein|nr:metallopeptidase TldD-related protein [Myxococcota bacterium]
MKLSRRKFLAGTGAGAVGLAVGGMGMRDAHGARVALSAAAVAPKVLSHDMVAPADTDGLMAVADAALAAAKTAGASFADVRLVRLRNQQMSAREDHITGLSDSESFGLGVRVIVEGTWGFAASYEVSTAAADRVAKQAATVAKADGAARGRAVELAPEPMHRDTWRTPLVKDPFKIPLEHKAALLLDINKAALAVKGAKYCNSYLHFVNEWKLYVSSEGSVIEQDLIRCWPGLDVTAVSDSGDYESRAHDAAPRQAGWEYVTGLDLVADAPRIAEDAVKKLAAAEGPVGKLDLVLHPTHLWLTIHESVGHPTELDRALGYEANFAGTSFCTVDKLGRLKFAADGVTIYADRTTPGGLATCGFDDDGVATSRWDLVRKGMFVGYQTTREQAAWIGEKASRGCAYADSWSSVPFQRMPNVSLTPGEKRLTVDELIADTKDGVYIVGDGSYSIDHQRYNFQFGGQMFYEIKKGKLGRPLRHVAYQSNTVEFWSSCDAVCDERSWWMGGTYYDGKGEPGQVNAVSHGCAPSRFRKVNVLNAGGGA